LPLTLIIHLLAVLALIVIASATPGCMKKVNERQEEIHVL
jgi:hypothetical protein